MLQITKSQARFLLALDGGQYKVGRGCRVGPLREKGLIAVVDGKWTVTERGRIALITRL